ncbi:MAG TPA: DUF2339 domain-containing protein [Acidobacteriaceae bacterium]|nr:DUF2339 domain-containing protein [Acidobacteriaceae bacterium]
MDPNPSGGLEEQVAELRSRVRRLEEALLRQGIALPKPELRAPLQSASPIPPEAIPPAATAGAAHGSPAFPLRPPGAREDDRSLESRIGSHWFNRIGILAVLIGMAWFLKLAIDNHWIGPLGRVLIGLSAGAGIIAWSERFHRRGFAGFAYSLKAVGSGILYLSLWAGFSLFHLFPGGVAFAAMILVTAFNGFLSWVQNSELLAVYAILGGFSTPLLISTGGNHEISLFSYLLVLDGAVLILVALRPWMRLLFGAFTGTALFFAGWWWRFYNDAQSGQTAFFLACFFLIFAFAPRLIRIDPESSGHRTHWDALTLVLLPMANAGLGFLGFYAIFDPSGAGWGGPWLAVAFAAFYLLLLRLPARGVLRGSPALLSSLHLTAAVVFLTLAIPLKTHGRWLTIGWLVEGAALLWLALRMGSLLLRALALLCLALGLLVLVFGSPAAAPTPFLNQRFAAFFAGIAVFAFVARAAARAPAEDGPKPLASWPNIAAAAVLTVNLLILLAFGWEIHSYWSNLRLHGDWRALRDFRMYAQFTYSAFFMLFGAVLLGAGFWRGSAFLRWQALLLLAIAIGKVFLVDVSELSQAYRIVSFLGLGALLLAVSYIYQRDWLRLRGGEQRTS